MYSPPRDLTSVHDLQIGDKISTRHGVYVTGVPYQNATIIAEGDEHYLSLFDNPNNGWTWDADAFDHHGVAPDSIIEYRNRSGFWWVDQCREVRVQRWETNEDEMYRSLMDA